MKAFVAVVVAAAVVPLWLAGGAMPSTLAAGVGAASVPTAIDVGQGGYTDGCAVFSGGTVECWGYNGYGQLGTGSDTTAFSSTPVAVKGVSSANAVSIVRNATCALLSGGTVKCWGDNSVGELGNGTSTTDSLTPVAVKGISSARALSGGYTQACALLSGGTIDCWGTNGLGELGNGTTGGNSPTPAAVKGISGAKAVSAGGDGHACALLSGGAIDCWGNNAYGQLGDGPTTSTTGSTSLASSSTPVAVKGISSAIAVSTGGQDSCALLSGGSVKCWGVGANGQLGNGKIAAFATPTPVTVKGISTAKVISGGEGTTCALLSGGTVKCWGTGSVGALGDGANTNHSTPVAVRFAAPTRRRP